MNKEAQQNFLLDKRVVDRHVKKGLVSREEYEKYLNSLPDVAEQSEKMQTTMIDEPEEILDDDIEEE